MDKQATAGSIAKELANKNLQSTMAAPSYDNLDFFDGVDDQLSTMIYYFLMGKTDKLPTFEEIDAVKEKAERDVISVNCGIFLSKKMDITAYTPVGRETERVDYISQDDYYVDVRNLDGKALKPETVERIASIEIFDKERIKKLQEYLKAYVESKERSKAR